MKSKEHQRDGVTWVDVVNPTRDDLDKFATRFSLHSASVQDCLEPEHLPKFEKLDQTNFMILRAYDIKAIQKSDTIQGLTRKIAVFFNEHLILTLHRVEQPLIRELADAWVQPENHPALKPFEIVAKIILGVAKTYELGLDEVTQSFEKFETQVFKEHNTINLQKVYLLKRRTAIMRRMLRFILETIGDISELAPADGRHLFQNARESVDKILFQLDEVHESIVSLLSLHISLASQTTNEASHRANEVMRLLTIFSVFFLPLNFIAGIYGMNFEFMPELKLQWGYPLTLLAMAAVATAIFIWIRLKGWIGKR